MATAAMILKPTPDRTPDEWADANRILPIGSAEPGQWRSSRAPHMIPIARCAGDPNVSTVVAVMGSQMSKTETMVNVIGQTIDDNPAPCLYIAPTKSFCEKVFEPRLSAMIEGTESLRKKKRPGKQTQKTQKFVAGVSIRLAWAGSATEMAGDPAKLVFVDERDRMTNNVDGEGDPKELADARHATYADGQTWVFSTPTEGNAETEVDDATGLEFWKVPDDPDTIQSATWKLFLEGTRSHWAIPCPSCNDYFIPRFKLLTWSEGVTPEQALDSACLACSHCGTLIDQVYKEEMHGRGVFVSPGQRITKTGKVLGLIPKTDVRSFWVSGLMSPWKTWGDRAAAFLRAVNSGSSDKIQAVINTGMGELWSVGGDVVDEDTLAALKVGYKNGEVPNDISNLVAGVDVQKERLYYTIRGFGADMVSAKIDSGELLGDTSKLEVWNDLATLRDRHYNGLPVERCFIDSGYRTTYVYDFCRRFKEWAIPTKGRDTIEASPLVRTKLDVGKNTGRRLAGGLAIYNINTDFFKKWLVDRFERDPSLPGGWFLPEDESDEYLKSMRSEARVVKPSGRAVWILLHPANHFWDCEVNALACAYSLNFQMITSESVERERHRLRQREQQSKAAESNQGSSDPFRKNNVTTGGHFGGSGGWFGGRR
jgi:phage terminase large subunit GpA-like protein